jgi:nucleoside-diphosphate-sugar epimerase
MPGRSGRRGRIPVSLVTRYATDREDTVVNVVITGGCGFLGSRLARDLLAAGELAVAGGPARPLGRVTLIDLAPVPPDVAADQRVTGIRGDLLDLLAPRGAGPPLPGSAAPPPGSAAPPPGSAARDAVARAEVIFHLAAAVSGECEADFDLGMRANLAATEALLACCRDPGGNPVLVYSSSLAVFGDSPDHPLPAVVDDHTPPNPQTSYGTQKAMGELLLADYTRKGYLRGRAVRLATVAVRPGRPNAAASGFASSIVREPLAGRRAACPVGPQTLVALASPARAVAALLRAATAAEHDWGGRGALLMPALTVSVAEIADALRRVAGPGVSELIDWVPDPAVSRIVAGWPTRVRAERAARLGLTADPDIDSVIGMHLAERRRMHPAGRDRPPG